MRKVLAAAGAAVLVAGSSAATVSIEGALRSQPKIEVVSPGRVQGAATLLGRECLNATADGTTTQTGAGRNLLTVIRKFSGGISCEVVRDKGAVLNVFISDEHGGPMTDDPTTYSMVNQGSRITGSSATSWGFQEVVQPGSGPSTAIEGYAATNGQHQSFADGRLNAQTGPYSPVASSIELGLSRNRPDLTTAVFNLIDTGAQSVMASITHQNQ